MSAFEEDMAKAQARLDEALRKKKEQQQQQNGHDSGEDTLFQRGVRIVTGNDFIKSFRPPDLAVPGLQIRKHAVYAMSGRTGHGKTGIVLHLSLCKASGWDFAGDVVPIGRVLILAGENPEDHLMRLILAQNHYGLSDDVIDRIKVLPHAFPLHKHVDEVVAMAAAHGPFDLVFVETAAAYFHGEDDNANMPMRDLAVACRSLTRISGEPCVIVPAHPNKAANAPDAMVPRGGGAFLNEMDGNLSVFSTDIGTTTVLHWCGKWRGPTFEPITSACIPVPRPTS